MRDLRRRILIELGVVAVLFLVAAFIWFLPASRFLLMGDGSVMVGDGSDSLTNPWQYELLLETLRKTPSRFFFGAVYTDHINTPEGYAAFIPWSERLIVLALSPFVRVELMPTMVVGIYVIVSGVAMYVLSRLLGWSRTLAFALAFAWAICPYTRARAECHIALVGVFFAPLAACGVRLLAGSPRRLGWSSRTDLLLASACFLIAASAAHYYAIILIAFAPLYAFFYLLLLPRAAPRVRALGRLLLAAAPAALLLLSTKVLALAPADAARLAPAVAADSAVAATADVALRIYGARPIDYLAGDVAFGTRDVLPSRSALTARIRDETPVNRHERTNGIRWSVLTCASAAALVVLARKGRRRLTRADRRFVCFSLLLGVTALAMSFSPNAFRYFDAEVGPIALLARYVPAFRVPNRFGVLVHFAGLLAAGVFVTFVTTTMTRSRRSAIPAGLFLALVFAEYLPLHPVEIMSVPRRRTSLLPTAADGSPACGAGITVPYVTFAFQVDHYYTMMSELRGTSCKLLHAGYLTREDDVLRDKLSTRSFDEGDLARALAFARCTNASWAVFRLDAPDTFKTRFCSEMGWSFVASDACRAVVTEGPARSVRECLP